MLSLHPSHPRTRQTPMPAPYRFVLLLLLAGLLTTWLFHHLHASSPPAFPTEEISENLTIDWSDDATGPNGDFDPWNRCPDDFFKRGFVLLCKRLQNGTSVKFLLHRGKKLLYRIDQDVIGNKVKYGLHWVTGTNFNARYRIADKTFRGGKSVAQPTPTKATTTATYHYGDAVSKRQSRYGREFFRSTHIGTDNCPDWPNLFNFTL